VNVQDNMILKNVKLIYIASKYKPPKSMSLNFFPLVYIATVLVTYSMIHIQYLPQITRALGKCLNIKKTKIIRDQGFG